MPNDRLPSSLFAVYQTYKRGTSVVLEWLTTFDKASATIKPTTPPLASNTLTIKQLLERAEMASKCKLIPPPTVHDAFRMVLVNRNRLTKYYDTLPAASAETAASTLRHKVFNDTLAKAYSILFPPITQERQPKKPFAKAAPRRTVFSANTFDALSHLVEEESDFDACASAFWQEVTSSTPAVLTISDDSVSDALALHTYVLELQTTIQTIRGFWDSAADGEIPLAVAGWLTNMAHYYLISWIHAQGPAHDDHEKTLGGFFSKAQPKGQREGYVSMSLEDPVGLRELSEQEVFLEFTHGHGLVWPSTEIRRFFDRAIAKDESLGVVERCKFEDYFKAQPDQRSVKHDFVDSIQRYLPTEGADTVQEHYRKLLEISDARYKQDQEMVQSLYRSVCQSPLWDYRVFPKHEDEPQWTAWGDNPLQFPIAVPLLWNLKAYQEPDGGLMTSLVMGTHMLLESCRSFAPSAIAQTRSHTNNRIRVLSLARNARTALDELLKTSVSDPVKAGWLYTDAWSKGAYSTIQQFQNIASEKSFDLYTQSPWVTGSYMATIMSRNMDLGLELLNQHGYASDLLHLYNMLRQLGVLCVQIPILDHLCDLLGSAIFPYSEGRPTSKFDLMARTTNRMPMCKGENKFYRAKGTTTTEPYGKEARIKPFELSCFAKECIWYQYSTSPKFLARITDERYLAKKHDFKPEILMRYTPSEIILRAKDHVMPEFEGPFPLAKINYFAVAGLVMDVWKEVACQIAKPGGLPDYLEQYMEDTKDHPDHLDLRRNHVSASMLFLQMVRWGVDSNKFYHTFGSRRGVQEDKGLVILRDAVVQICGDVKLQDFLWKDV
ncbi:uncharacterized protein J4E88_007195 [Alternaria novae-zelandiae]|uniref:uncharacterized protein n=1 Tax=Alternaria novae-zelandiae TaxID=430562 RepID=UPI0020C29B27|nr:uncharacterized protein J4E88_007195 [Alternaria novae-zelandiae]KAI4676281.1 hypothetical protein J4E88_007195 [Alternaria novae-zelandiae]